MYVLCVCVHGVVLVYTYTVPCGTFWYVSCLTTPTLPLCPLPWAVVQTVCTHMMSGTCGCYEYQCSCQDGIPEYTCVRV